MAWKAPNVARNAMASNSYGMWFLGLFGGVGWVDGLGRWLGWMVGKWLCRIMDLSIF